MPSTPHMLTNNVKLLHKVTIISNQKVLILKRSSSSTSRPDCWDLPGGNSEWPQNKPSGFDYHQHDISRELQEEINLNTKPSHFTTDNLNYLRTYYDATKDIYTIICGWKLVLDHNPDIVLSSEHTEHVWINISELDSCDFGGERGDFIKDIIRSSATKLHDSPTV